MVKKRVFEFFVGEFHEGWVNRILHSVGLILFVIGMWEMNWIIIILGMTCMEGGHVFNFFIRSKRKLALSIKEIAIAQLVLTVIGFAVIGSVVIILKKVLYGN